jgi:hypothetical protein
LIPLIKNVEITNTRTLRILLGLWRVVAGQETPSTFGKGPSLLDSKEPLTRWSVWALYSGKGLKSLIQLLQGRNKEI